LDEASLARDIQPFEPSLQILMEFLGIFQRNATLPRTLVTSASGSQPTRRHFRRRCSCQRLSPIGSLRCPSHRSRTLRSPTAGIGTELLAPREKIEVTRHGSEFDRSPVPMGRAHRHDTRSVCALPRRIPQTWHSVAERAGFELSAPFLVYQTRANGSV